MIPVKSAREIDCMRKAGALAGAALRAGGQAVQPGITTGRLDEIIARVIRDGGGTPTFLGYNGFPASACISINEQVIHGIPGARKLREGDIVSIDVGACIGGFNGDCAATFAVGAVSEEAERLVRVTRESFYKGLACCREGFRIGDVSHAVQSHAEAHGYGVVRDFTGHGVGAALHEEPDVPNFGEPGRGPRLLRGMTIAIEPMINQGVFAVKILPDRWTVVTADGKLSAHYEHSVLITAGQPELLTAWEEES